MYHYLFIKFHYRRRYLVLTHLFTCKHFCKCHFCFLFRHCQHPLIRNITMEPNVNFSILHSWNNGYSGHCCWYHNGHWVMCLRMYHLTSECINKPGQQGVTIALVQHVSHFFKIWPQIKRIYMWFKMYLSIPFFNENH